MNRWTEERNSMAYGQTLETQRTVCALLRALPPRVAPQDLRVQLQVVASKERLMDRRPGWRLRAIRTQVVSTIQDLMKPIALPAAGGTLATILLFMSLMPTFAQNPSGGSDVPIGLFTEPALKTLKPIGFQYGDAVVDLRIDGQGRLINYSIVSGAGPESGEIRRSIENNLLFTTFTPATAFGIPVNSTLRLSFRSSHIDVKG